MSRRNSKSGGKAKAAKSSNPGVSSEPQVLFDSGEVDSALPMASGYDQPTAPGANNRRPMPVMKQPFSIYTVLLILSFVFLTAAAVMFFIDAGNYQ